MTSSSTGDRESALRWRINRLRCMTPWEVVYRIARRLALLRPGFRACPDAAAATGSGVQATHWLPHLEAGIDPAPYVEAAARIARGRLDMLALTNIEYGMPPRWNRHPLSGFEWPLEHGTRLLLRNEQRGDIKYLWEPNRHLHLVTLAQAYRLSGDPAHAKVLFTLLDSWFEQCPFPLGPNWASAMEAALRLINWALCWQMLGGEDCPLFADAAGAALRLRWLDSIYRHLWFVRHNLSLFSSANNHLIGELTGLRLTETERPRVLRAVQPEGEALELVIPGKRHVR